MAYDEDLANELRAHLANEQGISERAMFGGLAFLLNGNMALAASGRRGLMARVDPTRNDEFLDRPNAEQMIMRGRAMTGWIRVDPVDDDELPRWVEDSLAYARTLPAKRK